MLPHLIAHTLERKLQIEMKEFFWEGLLLLSEKSNHPHAFQHTKECSEYRSSPQGACFLAT
jgi:hypothetical protein